MLVALSMLLAPACAPCDAPRWSAPEAVAIGAEERTTLDLAALVDDAADVRFSAEASPGVLARVDGGRLVLLAAQGFTGESDVTLRAENACGAAAETTLTVRVGSVPTASGTCDVTVRAPDRTGAESAYLAGVFNDWNPRAQPMTRGAEGWEATLALPPGSYPYKIVENDPGDATDTWACNPDEPYVQCDAGYRWDPSCTPGGESCNSLLRVLPCDGPRLTLEAVDADRDADTFAATVRIEGEDVTVTATLDDVPVGRRDGDRLILSTTALSDGRHTLRVTATDGAGRAAPPLHVPFWLDSRTWDGGLMYYAFVDRFANGDPGNDGREGTTSASTDYVGGDWAGLTAQLDALADLGVTVLWITAPQDNPPGAWGSTCDATYSGYHGYWPASAHALEEHFGDEDAFGALIDGAHARGIRVLADWVGNHVHEDHPYVQSHPDWFTNRALCGDANNWNDIPETCWFDSFLPDVRYYDVDPLETFVDDAVTFARRWNLDGYRVDAVKHMPHSVFHNFSARARAELEHVEDFYTVGETFSGDRALIASYVGPTELDGQFDFPLYWAIVAAFARDEIGLSSGAGSLRDVAADSRTAWGGALMSTFLGNHDVARFIAQASGEIGSLYGDSACGDGGLRTPDVAPGWDEPYRRLMLAWSFLLTTEGLPLVYYGDEIGLPGYNDPDNRQPMRFTGLTPDEQGVRDHVAALGALRRDHPAASVGDIVSWWENEPNLWAYARVTGDDAVLVVLNRGDSPRTLSNGLAWAGLAAGTWTDVLTGEPFTSSGDTLVLDVPALASRVLVRE
jgi:glycosidase